MSVIRADNVAPSAGGTAKSLVRGVASAWANLNGTGTIALRDSENVSSVVDVGTGTYDYNFTSAMATATYSRGAASISYVGSNLYIAASALENATHTVSKTRSYAFIQGTGAADEDSVPMIAWGDLA